MIGVLYKGNKNLIPQYGVEYKLISQNDYNIEYILLMDENWDFNSNFSLSIMYNYLQQFNLILGVYSDIMIKNLYKNNLAFDTNLVQIENIMSPVLLKNMPGLNFGNKQEDILKTPNLFLRIPEILFILND